MRSEHLNSNATISHARKAIKLFSLALLQASRNWKTVTVCGIIGVGALWFAMTADRAGRKTTGSEEFQPVVVKDDQPERSDLEISSKVEKVSVGSRDNLPAQLSRSEWNSISAAHETGKYAIERIETGWQGWNPSQQWVTRFDGRGFLTTPAGSEQQEWSWGLEFASYGYGDRQKMVSGEAPEVITDGVDLRYRWDGSADGGIEEWYKNERTGLEHGFTLKSRPGEGSDDERLMLTLRVRGNLIAETSSKRTAVSFRQPEGGAVINYAGLKVWDADGKELPSWFEDAGEAQVRLVVDDRTASYPVTIDPTARQAYLKASNADNSDYFGTSVSISGDTLVVGAPNEDSSATGVDGNQGDNSSSDSGAVYIFVRSGTTWTQQAYLKASNTGSGDGFGTAVAISGDTVIVGAPKEDSSATGADGNQADNSAIDSGAVYVFVRTGTTWSQQAYLKSSNSEAGDQFGQAISISGETVVVGSPGEDGSASGVDGDQSDNFAPNSGAAYVLVRSGTTWNQQAYLKASLVYDDTEYGRTVSISGNTIAVGTRGYFSHGTPLVVDIFVRSGTSWTFQGYLESSKGDYYSSSFGRSVSISGDTIAVTTTSPTMLGVSVFVRSGTTWSWQATLEPLINKNSINFNDGYAYPYSVAIFQDLLVFGVPYDYGDLTTPLSLQYRSGAAYVYERDGIEWNQKSYLTSNIPNSYDLFGIAVAAAQNTVVAGHRNAWSNDGGVFVFDTSGPLTKAPTNVLATPVSMSQIDLSWTDVAVNETGYRIERRQQWQSTGTVVATLPPDTTSYQDTGLIPSTTYTYFVSALSPTGEANGTFATSTTYARTLAPLRLTATAASTTQIDLSWTDVATNETGYRIERRLASETAWIHLQTLDPNSRSYRSMDLSPSTEYLYRVSAVAPGGALVSAPTVSATTLAMTTVAPTNVVATAVSSSRIGLSWTDGATNEIGYRIERRLAAEVGWTHIVTLQANITSFQDGNLTASTEYFYRVSAVDPGNLLASGAVVSATTFAGPAVAPANLVATAVSSSQINLSWTDVATNEIGYRIERRRASETVWVIINTLSAGATSYQDRWLSASTSYFYRVSTIKSDGDIESAPAVSATTREVTVVAPTNVIATAVSPTQINLSWTDGSTDETGYKVERITSDWTQVSVLQVNSNSFQDKGLLPSTRYTYRVSAMALDGTDASAPTVSATTFDLTTTLPPTDIVATAVSSSQVDLSWTDRSTNELGYRVMTITTNPSLTSINWLTVKELFDSWTPGSTDPTISVTAVLPPNTTSYQHKELLSATGYVYRISAITPENWFVNGEEVFARTPLDIPTNVTATVVSPGRINLSWADAATNETGYRVERRLTSEDMWTFIRILPPNTNFFQDDGLTASTSYTYRVSAVASNGELFSAPEVSATTHDRTDPPILIDAESYSATQINLSWIDIATNETGYRIERRPLLWGQWAEVATIAANASYYQDTGLTPGRWYIYRISAVAPGGWLASGEEVFGTTLVTDAATDVTATAFSSTQINLSWVDTAANEIGYRVERRLMSTTTWTEVARLAANVTSYQNTGLTPSTWYAYRISSIAPDGRLVSAGEVSTVTYDPTAAPTRTLATAQSTTQVNLSWVDVATNETGYRIERRNMLPTDSEWNVIASLAANVTSFQNTGLTASTGYLYKVSAIAPGGTPVSGTEVEVTTPPTDAATGVRAIPFSSTEINLSWVDVATNETGYRISRRLTEGTTWSVVSTLPANSTSYKNTGLAVATEYTYVVSTIAPDGMLVSAGAVSATTYGPTAAPTAITATAFSKNQINLRWTDAATNETGYQVTRRLTSGTAWTVLANLEPGATSYNDTGLTEATGYTYVVSAIAPGGALMSAAAVAATTFGPTAAPTGVSATTFSSSQINLKWTDAATNETGYRIESRLTTGTEWADVATLAANVTTYNNTELTPSTGYTYRVSAIAPGGALVSAATVAATTFGRTAGPTGITAAAFSTTQINLSWTDAATNETGYRISRRLTAGTIWTDVTTVAANATRYSDTGLTAATGYTYRVSAVAPGGALVSGSDVAATTHAVTAVPTGVTATAFSTTQINLRWNDVAINETGYQIARRLTSGTALTVIATLAANTTTYQNTGLTAATGYTYVVSAIAPGGALVSAAGVAATTFGPTAVPTGVSATTFSSGQINLKWTDAATNETGYRIESRLTTGTEWADVATLAANVTTYNNTGLTPSTGYTYRVSAIAPGGSLVSAATVAATTFGPTAAPTGITATAFSSTQINLSWTDVATNETGYRISRRLTAGTIWTDVTTVAANTTRYSNTGLTAATDYTYRVSAVAPGGALVSGSDVAAMTLAVTAVPTGVTATAISTTQINLRWNDVAINETGYQIARRLTSGTALTVIATLAANTTTYQNTGLTAATGYTYVVSAIAPGGALVSAAGVAATTFAPTVVPSSRPIRRLIRTRR